MVIFWWHKAALSLFEDAFNSIREKGKFLSERLLIQPWHFTERLARDTSVLRRYDPGEKIANKI